MSPGVLAIGQAHIHLVLRPAEEHVILWFRKRHIQLQDHTVQPQMAEERELPREGGTTKKEDARMAENAMK